MQTEPTPSRRAARLAWALCALSVAFGAATVALALHYAALGPFAGLTRATLWLRPTPPRRAAG